MKDEVAPQDVVELDRATVERVINEYRLSGEPVKVALAGLIKKGLLVMAMDAKTGEYCFRASGKGLAVAKSHAKGAP